MKGHVYPANKYLLKFSNRNGKKRFAIGLKFKIKTYSKPFSGVSIVGFEKQIYSLHVGAL